MNYYVITRSYYKANMGLVLGVLLIGNHLLNEKKYIERKGVGRRLDDKLSRCIWCESKEEAVRLRWKDHHEKDMERQANCNIAISELRLGIDKMAEQKVDKFTVSIIVTIVLSILILSGGFNAYLIQSMREDLRTHTQAIIKNGK